MGFKWNPPEINLNPVYRPPWKIPFMSHSFFVSIFQNFILNSSFSYDKYESPVLHFDDR